MTRMITVNKKALTRLVDKGGPLSTLTLAYPRKLPGGRGVWVGVSVRVQSQVYSNHSVEPGPSSSCTALPFL